MAKVKQKTPLTKEQKRRHRGDIAVHKQGRKSALDELQDEDTIYMLAESPVYIHSRIVYYNAGYKTAVRILEKDLAKVVDKVHSLIPAIVNKLDEKLTKIYTTLNFTNFNDFSSWWTKEVEPYGRLQEDSEALYYLSLLEQIKNNATSISAYNFARTDKTGTKLYESGFVAADFVFKEGTKARKGDAITAIKSNQRNLLQELSIFLKSKLPIIDNDIIKNSIANIQKKFEEKNVEVTHAIRIGKVYEYLSSLYERNIDDSIKIIMENVSAENSGKKVNGIKKDSKVYKADTKMIVQLGTLILSFLSSDKTGMHYKFGSTYDPNKRNTIDQFTADITTDTLDIFGVESVVDFNEIDPYINNIFQYIVNNSDYFVRQGESAKQLITSFFAWAKIITELVGDPDNVEDMPVVVRIFNRLYKTSDILQRFTTLQGVDILQYVVRSYMENFYNTFRPTGLMDREKLRKEKKRAMQQMTENMNYKKLKLAINDTLSSLVSTLSRAAASKKTKGKIFQTGFQIIMSNVSNLK